jgi:hypothetical protein
MSIHARSATVEGDLPKTRDFARIADRYDESRNLPSDILLECYQRLRIRVCCIEASMSWMPDAEPDSCLCRSSQEVTITISLAMGERIRGLLGKPIFCS